MMSSSNHKKGIEKRGGTHGRGSFSLDHELNIPQDEN
jgi:hypothetical protein